MPKIKTHKGAAKRFQIAGSRIKRKHANKKHNFTKRAPKPKRQLRGTTGIAEADLPRARRMLKIS